MASCNQSHLLQSIFIATGAIFFMTIPFSFFHSLGQETFLHVALPPLLTSLSSFSPHTSLSHNVLPGVSSVVALSAQCPALLLSFATWPSLYLPPKLICISQASLSSSTNFLVKNMDQRETLILCPKAY